MTAKETNRLNEQQRAAAGAYLDGEPYQVIEAVAGSGKTTVAAARIDYLVEIQNIAPRKIIAITFTRSGGETLKRKIAHSIGYAGTLHGLAMKILCISPDSLLTDEEENELVKEILSETGLKKKISLKDAERILMNPEKSFGDSGVFSRTYSNTLTRAGRWTHNEVLRRFLYWLESKGANDSLKIDVLIVDEAQDTSAMDAAIYRALKPARLTVAIGDENQSIYQFRGASRKWMRKIKALAGQGDGVTPLSMSYRFGAAIAQRAASISGAKVTGNPVVGSVTSHQSFENERDEETFLIEWTKEHAEAGCAILTRYNADVKRITDALQSAGRVVAPSISLSFNEKSDCAIVAAVARIILEPDSVKGFDEIAAFPDDMKDRLRARWNSWENLKGQLTGPARNLKDIYRLFMVSSDLLANAIFTKENKIAKEILADIANNETGNQANDNTGIHVCTIHASKGREWNAVAVSGWDSRLNSEGSANLPYVAITRGKRHVLTTRCETIVSRWTGGKEETAPFKVLFG